MSAPRPNFHGIFSYEATKDVRGGLVFENCEMLRTVGEALPGDKLDTISVQITLYGWKNGEHGWKDSEQVLDETFTLPSL